MSADADGAGKKPDPLPRYRCHKVVEAAQIVAVNMDGPTLLLDINPGQEVQRIASHTVSVDWFKKHNPQQGGFLVRYEPDGYESYSPPGPFLSGYTRVEEAHEN